MLENIPNNIFRHFCDFFWVWRVGNSLHLYVAYVRTKYNTFFICNLKLFYSNYRICYAIICASLHFVRPANCLLL